MTATSAAGKGNPWKEPWWCTPVVLALRGLRRDFGFKARPGRAVLEWLQSQDSASKKPVQWRAAGLQLLAPQSGSQLSADLKGGCSALACSYLRAFVVSVSPWVGEGRVQMTK